MHGLARAQKRLYQRWHVQAAPRPLAGRGQGLLHGVSGTQLLGLVDKEEVIVVLKRLPHVFRPVAHHDDFFANFGDFAARSRRADYWHGRLAAFRSELGSGNLCEDDTLLVVAAKGRSSSCSRS